MAQKFVVVEYTIYQLALVECHAESGSFINSFHQECIISFNSFNYQFITSPNYKVTKIYITQSHLKLNLIKNMHAVSSKHSYHRQSSPNKNSSHQWLEEKSNLCRKRGI